MNYHSILDSSLLLGATVSLGYGAYNIKSVMDETSGKRFRGGMVVGILLMGATCVTKIVAEVTKVQNQ